MGHQQSLVPNLLIFGLMAALAVVEIVAPLRGPPRPAGARLRFNLGLTALFVIVNVILTLAVVGAAGWLQSRNAGLLNRAELPIAAHFLIGIAVLDFFGYLVHVLLHKTPWLWRLHRLHHSDGHVDVTTAFRQHPLETVLRFAFTFVPAVLLGVSAGATAAYRLVSGVNAVLEHANVRVPRSVDRWLRWLIVTPDMHKIHHSRRAVETDSNYGNILSIHDRLWRTYTPAAADLRFGLEPTPPSPR